MALAAGVFTVCPISVSVFAALLPFSAFSAFATLLPFSAVSVFVTACAHMRLKGAGIVPFFLADDGEPTFIFARERFEKDWCASNQFSGFSGSPLAGEIAPEQVAVREFFEESMGCFGSVESAANPHEARTQHRQDLQHLQHLQLLQQLQADRYSLRVWSRHHRIDASAKHVTYVVEFASSSSMDWRRRFERAQALVVRTHAARARLLHARRIVQAHNEACLLLNTTLAAAYGPYMRQKNSTATAAATVFLPILPLDCGDRVVTQVAFHDDALFVRFALFDLEQGGGGESNGGGTDRMEKMAREAEVRLSLARLPDEVVTAYAHWFEARCDVERSLASAQTLCPSMLIRPLRSATPATSTTPSSPHPCGAGHCASTWFRDSFLEKDMLLCLSLRDIGALVHNNAHFGLFRREFAAVLVAIMTEFGVTD